MKEDYTTKILNNEEDPLYNESIDFVIEKGVASPALLQRKFLIGYNRATKIINSMEAQGIIESKNETRPRKVLIKDKSELK